MAEYEYVDILTDDVFAEQEEFLEHVGRSVLDGAPRIWQISVWKR